MRVVPKPNHFKRILRKKTNEESRLKGENKVECKKWSAKGTYRKASADREPTQDLNTLGGQRPRADTQGASAHSAGPGFFCLWVCGFVGLWVCGVVGLWGCGVVGLWCVCVFYWPRGSQKAPNICFVRQLLPKPNKNGTQIDHKWNQSVPGGGRGNRKSTKI